MTNRIARSIQAVVIAALLAIAVSAAIAPDAHAGEGTWKAHRVGLGDALTPPTVLHYLRPHRSITYTHGRDGHNCPRGGWFSDVSAYAWNGTAIGAQVDYDDYDAWSVRSAGHGAHGHVTFDGITFWNGSNVPVLVAAWCE